MPSVALPSFFVPDASVPILFAQTIEGAVPAAVLAILTELGFELVERVVLPGHLRSR